MHVRIRALYLFTLTVAVLPLVALASPLVRQDAIVDRTEGKYSGLTGSEGDSTLPAGAADYTGRKLELPWRDPAEGGGSMLDVSASKRHCTPCA